MDMYNNAAGIAKQEMFSEFSLETFTLNTGKCSHGIPGSQ